MRLFPRRHFLFLAPLRLAASFCLLSVSSVSSVWSAAAESAANESATEAATAAEVDAGAAEAPDAPRRATEADRERFREAMTLLDSADEADREEARTLLEALSAEFPYEAAVVLGEAWLRGAFDGEPDLTRAKKWLKSSGQAGNARAWLLLAGAYAELEGEAHAATATEYYRKAGDLESPEAWLELGRRTLYGLGTEANEQAGQKLLDQALAEGRYQAYVIYADYLLTEEKTEQAIAALRGGVEQEHLGSMERLATVLSQPERSPAEQKEAVELLEQAADGGLRSAQITMVNQELEKDEPRMTKVHGWTVGAARQGSPEAQQSLALMYYQGKLSGISEPVAAAGWFKLAAEAGLPVAQFMYGTMLERGEGGLRPDQAKALENYRAAMEQGHARAALACARYAAAGFEEEAGPNLPKAYALAKLSSSRGERQNDSQTVNAAKTFMGEMSSRMGDEPELFVEAIEAYKALEAEDEARLAELERQAAEAAAAREAAEAAREAKKAEAKAAESEAQASTESEKPTGTQDYFEIPIGDPDSSE
jgi:TPR repeat protein